YRYDELGNLQTLVLPDQRELNHLYYGSGHLHQINLNGRVISDFERDAVHDEVLRTQGKLVTRTRYDTSGRLAGKAIHYRDAPAEVLPLLDKAYRYDASDNLIAEVLTQTQRRGMTNAANDENAHLEQIIGRFDDLPHTGKTYSGHNRYGYDLNEQLQTVQQSRPNWQATQVEDYKYDKAGNLFDGPKLNGLIKHNRVLVYQDKRYRYDRFGRLCEKRIGSNWVQYFEYDAEQRLVCVEQYRSGERERVVFAYDPLGRRISKEVYQKDYPEPRRRVLFHWQGLRLLQEVQSGLASLYVYDSPNSYEPLARIDGNQVNETFYYFHSNLAGLPEQLTDSDGKPIWQSDYQGWGATHYEWNNPQHAREQNFRFQGQYLDRELELHYNVYRYYDPNLGRFTQHDPIGLAGGINLYRYAPNAKTWSDPLGLIAVDTPGYTVYGLYDGNPLTTKPYYIGITNDIDRRAAEHEMSGRLPKSSSIAPIKSDITYGQARGQEQYYIEKYQTRTEIIGQPTSSANRGNKYNSFDLSRTDDRAIYFKQAYNEIKAKFTRTPANLRSGACK
ncbi:RHS repeat-associated core domain-containing protein, partial [Pseudomonas putida]|uniref:RHS repeat-associated core domain-containing protein n=1 Tax=Pseudomonas putida TaxID=303 RepID=UPI001E31FAF7